MNQHGAARTLAAIIAVEGLAHLAKRRFFDTLVPNRLQPLRREIEIATGSLQLAGATALFIPRLRQTSRWINVPVQVVTLLAAVDNVRHPERFRRQRVRVSSVQSLVSRARVPPRVAAAVLIWWATRPTPTRVRSHSAGRAG